MLWGFYFLEKRECWEVTEPSVAHWIQIPNLGIPQFALEQKYFLSKSHQWDIPIFPSFPRFSHIPLFPF